MYEMLETPPHTHPFLESQECEECNLVVRSKDNPKYFAFGLVSVTQTTDELSKTLSQELSSSHLARPLHAALPLKQWLCVFVPLD